MTTPAFSTQHITPIIDQPDDVQSALLALNNANARETSLLDESAWQSLLREAFMAVCLPDNSAFLLVLNDKATYQSPNYAWFQTRYRNFAYVDRIVVAESHRSLGLGRLLYEHLFKCAVKAGYQHVFCEVNQDPPNPGSDAFHQRLGFAELGVRYLEDRDKTVRYLGNSELSVAR